MGRWLSSQQQYERDKDIVRLKDTCGMRFQDIASRKNILRGIVVAGYHRFKDGKYKLTATCCSEKEETLE